MRDDALNALDEGEPGGELGHARPQLAQLERGDVVVEVVEIREVVEDEPERNAGPFRHGPCRRLGVALAQQRDERLSDDAARALAAGDAAVTGRLVGEGEHALEVLNGDFRLFGRGGDAELDARIARSPGGSRGAGVHWPLPLLKGGQLPSAKRGSGRTRTVCRPRCRFWGSGGPFCAPVVSTRTQQCVESGLALRPQRRSAPRRTVWALRCPMTSR